MTRLILLTLIPGLFLFSISRGDALDGLDYQSESVATSSFVSSGIINPAALAFFSSMGLRYSHSFTDSTYKGDDALLISSSRTFFSSSALL